MFPPVLIWKIIHPIRCRLNKWHRGVAGILGDLKKTEYLSRDELCHLQETKLRLLCESAAAGSPYFRDILAETGLEPQQISLESLSTLPFLDKETIRNHFHHLVNHNYPSEQIFLNATGGSSGEPLEFYRTYHDMVFAHATTHRGIAWCGMKPGDSHVKLWGAPTDVQSATAGLKAKLWSRIYNQRIINAFDAGPDLFEKEYANFRKRPPFLLESYSSILYEFACYLDRTNKPPLHIPAVISSAGVLYDFQRESIQKMISGNVFNRYGSREFGNVAQECSCHSGLHINMERYIVEIVNADENGVGDILVTDLENHAFPFIRYRIGDKGIFSNQACPCGRETLMIDKIAGRELDIIRTTSGRLIAGEVFPHFFKDYPQILLGQVVQDRLDHIEIRLKLQADAKVGDLDPLIRKIVNISKNELTVTVNTKQDLIVNPTGKYRPVISQLEIQ